MKSINVKNKFVAQFVCILGMICMMWGIHITHSPLDITYFAGTIIFAHYYFSLKQYNQLMFISFLALMLMFPYMIGVINANQKEKFYSIEGTDQIVIEFLNDKAITAKFNKEKKAIYSEFKIIEVSSTEKQEIILNLIQVKNLKVINGEVID